MSEEGENKTYLRDKQVNAPSTIGDDGNRRWLYPDRRKGPRATKRKWVAILLIGFYFFAPWIQFAGRPLIRLDVLDQKAYFFGLVLKMTEFSFVFFILAILGLVLFLVTTLRGRIWCGYACPQTVFVEWVIRPIEELLEGPALKRKKQDGEPKNFNLLSRKILKQIAFGLVALLVANAFLGFFIDPKLIIHWVTSPPSQHPTAFGFVMFLSALMYFDLGWFREQFCSFLCPYARFQSVLLDKWSPSVAYDQKRGEPRGKGKDKGDCIDCELCVRVCPTGIDIRNGLQLECIQCERCIDACDSIMTNLKRPTGLLKIASPASFTEEKRPFWQRARVFVYSGLIAVVAVSGFLRIKSRDDLSLTILRQTGSAYSVLPDGRLSNVFNVRVSNNSGANKPLSITLKQPQSGVSLICPRCGNVVPAYGELLTPLLIVLDKDAAVTSVQIEVDSASESYDLPIISNKKSGD